VSLLLLLLLPISMGLAVPSRTDKEYHWRVLLVFGIIDTTESTEEREQDIARTKTKKYASKHRTDDEEITDGCHPRRRRRRRQQLSPVQEQPSTVLPGLGQVPYAHVHGDGHNRGVWVVNSLVPYQQ
jgi:hypothetical protein